MLPFKISCSFDYCIASFQHHQCKKRMFKLGIHYYPVWQLRDFFLGNSLAIKANLGMDQSSKCKPCWAQIGPPCFP